MGSAVELRLTSEEADRLLLLSEQLNSIQEAIHKTLMHGYAAVDQLSNAFTNKRRLQKEIGDLYAIVYLLRRRGDLNHGSIQKFKKHKIKRLSRTLKCKLT